MSMTIAQLKQELINNGVSLPPPSSKKEEYEKLYQEFVVKNRRNSGGDFSSDEDEADAQSMSTNYVDEVGDGSQTEIVVNPAILESVHSMSNETIYNTLIEYGQTHIGPVTDSTRSLYSNKLIRVLSSAEFSSQELSPSVSHNRRGEVLNGHGGTNETVWTNGTSSQTETNGTHSEGETNGTTNGEEEEEEEERPHTNGFSSDEEMETSDVVQQTEILSFEERYLSATTSPIISQPPPTLRSLSSTTNRNYSTLFSSTTSTSTSSYINQSGTEAGVSGRGIEGRKNSGLFKLFIFFLIIGGLAGYLAYEFWSETINEEAEGDEDVKKLLGSV